VSAREEKRHMARVYDTRASGHDRQLRLELSGENSKGTVQRFVADMPFYLIPYFITELSKAWEAERYYRTAEISRIDASLSKEQP